MTESPPRAPGRTPPQPGRERFDVGRDLLGPIFYDFCRQLRLYQAAYAGREPMALFMARGGVRLAWLYRLYLERTGLTAPCPQGLLWTSRFAAAKACLPGDYAYASQVFLREFNRATVAEMTPCLIYRDPERDPPLPDIRDLDPALARSRVDQASFDRLYWHESDLGRALRAHCAEQDRLLAAYLDQTAGRHRLVLLVDTGWFGSTQALLMRRFAQREWIGLYVGRLAEADRDPWHFDRVLGLCCSGAGYDPARPASALFEYHHLVEDPLEIACPSVQGYAAGDGHGRVRAVPQENGLSLAPPRDPQGLFAGVAAYFREARPDASGREIAAAAGRAAAALGRLIWHPRPDDLAGLTVRPRSADFGRDELVSVTNPPVPLRNLLTKRRQIHQALWSQGQIAREFPRFAYWAQLLYRASRRLSG